MYTHARTQIVYIRYFFCIELTLIWNTYTFLLLTSARLIEWVKRINRNQFDESAKVKKKRKIWFFSHVSWSMFFFWIVVCQIPKGSPPVVGALPYYMKMEGANQLSRSQTCRTLQQRVTDLKTIRICQKITYNSHLKKLKTPKKMCRNDKSNSNIWYRNSHTDYVKWSLCRSIENSNA